MHRVNESESSYNYQQSAWLRQTDYSDSYKQPGSLHHDSVPKHEAKQHHNWNNNRLSNDSGAQEDEDEKASKNASSLGSLNNQQERDLADYIAEEKLTSNQRSNKRRVLWQIWIFLMAVLVNQLISFREHLVIDVDKATPDSVSSMAVSIFQGIGFIIIGNLYDNVRMPKRLTSIILVILAVLTSLCAMVPAEVARDDSGFIDDQSYNQLLIQMSSIRMFESGVRMACLIILFNWYPMSVSALIVGLWNASYQIIPVLQELFGIDSTDYYLIDTIVMGILYLFLALVAYKTFYHHPAHIGVKIQKGGNGGKNLTNAGDFFLDGTPNMGRKMTPSQLGRVRHATVLDAFRYQSQETDSSQLTCTSLMYIQD